MLLTGTPVHAGPVAIREVIQVVGSYKNPPELSLRSFSQTAYTPASGIIGSTRADSRVNSSIDGISGDQEGLLAGVAIASSDPQGVDIIDQGELEGTICDCGEITIPGGGFPKWPLLFLAAIPFFFIGDCDNCDGSTPTPTPIPTPTPPRTPEVPEPASLFLLGTGLAVFGTGLRRRHAKSKLAAQAGAEG